MLRRAGSWLLLAALAVAGEGAAAARGPSPSRAPRRQPAAKSVSRGTARKAPPRRPEAPAARVRPAPEPPPAGELPGGGVGWSDATGWNAAETRVGPIRRIPLDGLRSINADPAPTPKRPLLERADRRAVVLVHEDLDPRRPVDVLLHLHGFDPGYRQDRQMSAQDPVRDKDVDRFEEQVRDLGPQLLVVLPQGGLHAGFSPQPGRPELKTFDMEAFLDEVLERLAVTRLLPARPESLRLLLSAHSGGGEALGVMLQGAARPQLVALFDAVNGPREELPRIERWLEARLSEDLAALRQLPPDGQRRYLQRGLRFRAFFTQSRLYTPLHDDPQLRFEQPGGPPLRPLRQFLSDWIEAHADEIGPADGIIARGLRRNYQIIDMPRASHGGLLGAGALRDALRALPTEDDPGAISRGQDGPDGRRPRS